MSEEQEQAASKQKSSSHSLFVPIALIAAGIFFLLDNLNVLPALDWSAVWRFWPLLLVFIGLNLLVTQVRRPLGSVLSVLVALAAVATFGYLLLAGAPERVAGRELVAVEAQAYPISAGSDAAESAEIEIKLSNYPTDISATNDDSLVSGTMWTTGQPDIGQDTDNGRAIIRVAEEPATTFLNPLEWMGNNEDRRWELRLNPTVPTQLLLDGGNGALTADLSTLTLVQFRLDGDNGSTTATLPPGEYAAVVDGGNGSIRLTFPIDGRQTLDLDGGNGSVRLFVPEGVEARVDFDEGNGNVSADDRFRQVSGENDRGVLETAGYRPGEGLEIEVKSGNGSVSITQP